MLTHKIKYNLKKQKQKPRIPSRDSAALSQRPCPSPRLGATSSQRLREHRSPTGTQERVLLGPVAFFPEDLNFDLLNQNDSENDDDIKKKSITMMKQGMAWSLSKPRVTLSHSAFCSSCPRVPVLRWTSTEVNLPRGTKLVWGSALDCGMLSRAGLWCHPPRRWTGWKALPSDLCFILSCL